MKGYLILEEQFGKAQNSNIEQRPALRIEGGPMILILAGTLIASLSLSYAWWTHVRVIRLRQDIFDLRDGLFDLAEKLGALGDPAYRVARRHLNAAANSVDIITPEFLAFLINRNQLTENPIPTTSNAELQMVIETTLNVCAERIVHSIFYETIVGRISLYRFWIRGTVSALETTYRKWCRCWLVSLKPEQLDQLGSMERREAMTSHC